MLTYCPPAIASYAAWRAPPKVILLEGPINDRGNFATTAVAYNSTTGLTSLTTSFPIYANPGDTLLVSNCLGITGLNGTWTAGSATTPTGDTVTFTAQTGLTGTPTGCAVSSTTALTYATGLLLSQLRAAYPAALIVGVGSTNGSRNTSALSGTYATTVTTPDTLISAAETQMQAAFTARVAAGDNLVGFIVNSNLSTGPIISGSGYQPNIYGPCNYTPSVSNGNASYDVSNDGVHNTDCGYKFWAKSIVPQWQAIIDALP